MRALLTVLFDNTGATISNATSTTFTLMGHCLLGSKLVVKIKDAIYDDFPPTLYRNTKLSFGEIWSD